jgi:peptidyl-prolyl cis-trans isomerase SurA
MRAIRFIAASLIAVIAGIAAASPAALAEAGGVIAVANDQPITEHDITQRLALLKILGDMPQQGMSRKQILRQLIDDQVKITEATRLNMMPSDSEVTDQVRRLSEGMKLTPDALIAKLRGQGVSEAAFRRYISVMVGFNRIISGKYRDDVAATDKEVDAKMSAIKSQADQQIARILADPRMKAVTVYSLMEISLPAEGDDPMLLQARAVEAAQMAQRFKGCGSARAAAEGIFNVKIGKTFDADASKLPGPLRSALDKAGTGRAVGPIRGKNGIQLIAFCGSRKIAPQRPDFKMPTRDQVKRAVINEKYDKLEERYLSTIRDKVYVEYRDQSYAQQ